MRIYVVEEYQQLSKKAANLLASQIRLKSNSVLGLATGSTPEGMYRELVRLHQDDNLDFSEVITFNLDEYYGLEKNNEQSYYYFMIKNLFSLVNINLENVHIPNGKAIDIQAECKRYEKSIKKAGGIDLQVLGIGRNGHIGFNEPDVKFEAITHLVYLDEETIKDNSRFFASIEDVPKTAISMGIKTIMQSKKILLLACGKEKAKIIKETIEGKITPETPASVLQLHPDVIFILDKQAASLLEKRKEHFDD